MKIQIIKNNGTLYICIINVGKILRGSQDRIIQRHWQQDTGLNKQRNNTYNTTKKTKGSQDRIIQRHWQQDTGRNMEKN